MLLDRMKILERSRERGFTLLESVIVVGLTALITVGVVVGLIEGLDTLHTVADTHSVEFGHQRAMNQFMTDVHAATWFFNDLVEDPDSGADIPRETTNPFYLILGFPGPNDEEVWVRYSTAVWGSSDETYLVRTVITESGADNGTSILSSGIANLEFGYLDENREFTDRIAEIQYITMTLSITVGGSTIQRIYEAGLRNPNLGVKEPPGDFDDVQSDFFAKAWPDM